MSEKAIGYSLLALGILIMIFSVLQVILVFTGKIKPIQIFTPPQTTQTKLDLRSPAELSSALSNGLPVNLDSIFPKETIAQSINLSAHFFLMSFIMMFGGRLATLGVQPVRPVYVKMKGIDMDATRPAEKN